MVYQCNICNKILGSKKCLRLHTEFIHLNKKRKVTAQCIFCRRGFYSRQMFDLHILSHIQERPYFCSICLREYSTRKSLDVHLKTHQPENLKKRFSCPLCSKTFSVQANSKRHLLSHTLEKPNKCEICGKSFQFKYKLTRHNIQAHINAKVRPGSYPCGVKECNASFKIESRLRRHTEQVHEQVKKVSCPICQKRFYEKWNLKPHLERVHNVKKLSKLLPKNHHTETNL